MRLSPRQKNSKKSPMASPPPVTGDSPPGSTGDPGDLIHRPGNVSWGWDPVILLDNFHFKAEPRWIQGLEIFSWRVFLWSFFFSAKLLRSYILNMSNATPCTFNSPEKYIDLGGRKKRCIIYIQDLFFSYWVRNWVMAWIYFLTRKGLTLQGVRREKWMSCCNLINRKGVYVRFIVFFLLQGSSNVNNHGMSTDHGFILAILFAAILHVQICFILIIPFDPFLWAKNQLNQSQVGRQSSHFHHIWKCKKTIMDRQTMILLMEEVRLTSWGW